MSYQPGNVPEKTEDIRAFLFEELRRIADALNPLETEGIAFQTLQGVPGRPRPAQVFYAAAGVLGVSEGLYRRDSGGTWVFVG